MNMLMNMNFLPSENNFYDEHGKVLKIAIIHTTVIDTLGTWTKLTAQQTLTLSADRPRNGQRTDISTFMTSPSSTVVSFLPTVVKNNNTDYTHVQ